MFSSMIKEDQEVTLGEAFNHIDQVPTNETSTDAFIGFVNEKEEVIQFLRYTDNAWLLDIPVQDSHTRKWNHELVQLEGISTAIVKRVIEVFFVDLDFVNKILTKYRINSPKKVENGVSYFLIDPTFIKWVEQHRSDEMYL